MLFFLVPLITLVTLVHCVDNGGFKVKDPDTGVTTQLTYKNQSAVIELWSPNVTSQLNCSYGINPFTIKPNLNQSTVCPRYFVGINNDNPQCSLDAKGPSCVEDLTVTGTLSSGSCDMTTRVCTTPVNRLVPLQSVISPAVAQSDYTLVSDPVRSGSQFGQSVDINATVQITGAPLAVSKLWPSLVTGAAFIFQSYVSFQNTSFSSLQWVQTQSLSPFITATSAEVTGSRFGAAVKLLCNTDNSLQFAAVGAPNARPTSTNNGEVFIYQNVGTVINIDGIDFPVLDPLQKLLSTDVRVGALFGSTLEFGRFRDGTRHLFVGAPGDRSGGGQNGAGAAWWYYWDNDISSWSGGTRLSCAFNGSMTTTAGSLCGTSLAFAQDPNGLALLAIGAPQYQFSGGLAGAGSITLFQWDPLTLAWVQLYGRVAGPGNSYYGLNYLFGYSLGFSGSAEWLFVGAPGVLINGTLGVGAVVVFQQAAVNTTVYDQYAGLMTIPTMFEVGGSPDQFGFSLKANWQSTFVVICAPGYGLIAVPNSGICFKFTYSNATALWNSTYLVIKGENPQSGSMFGYSVAVDLTQITTGSPVYNIGPIINGISSINYDITAFTYVKNTTCIQERGVLSAVMTMSCSFVLQKDIPPGFYMVSTNTTLLFIPASQIAFVVYDFSDVGSSHLDAYYSIRYYNPTIPQEDLFIFYIMSRVHTAVTMSMIAKVYLNV